MYFPLSRCPSCGMPGYCVTTLSDSHHRYICANLDCKGLVKQWEGEAVQNDAEDPDVIEGTYRVVKDMPEIEGPKGE